MAAITWEAQSATGVALIVSGYFKSNTGSQIAHPIPTQKNAEELPSAIHTVAPGDQ